MNRKMNLNVLLFLSTLLVLFFINSFQTERPAFSEIENRALKERPEFTWKSLLSGDYFVELENYFADTFVYREPLSKISRSMQHLTGWRGEDQVQLVVHHGANYGDPLESPLEKPLPTNDQPVFYNDSSESTSGDLLAEDEADDELDVEKEKDVEKEMDEPVEMEEETLEENHGEAKEEETTQDHFQQVVGRILLMRDKAMNLYTFDQAAGKAYAELLNQFAERVTAYTEQDVKVYSLLAPTQIEFISNSEYKQLSSPQDETLNYINGRLDDSVTVVDAYASLEAHADDYLYFRTDHHWTARGAYYAYQAFMEASERTPVKLEDYEVEHVEDFLGSTYAATLSPDLERNPDTIELFQPFIPHEYHVYYEGPLKMDLLDMNHADKTNKYRIFLSGDRPLGKITTEAEGEGKIAVIKDSYANAFVPFLLPHYREIYIIDPRQFSSDIFEYIAHNEINEVIFMTNMGVTSHQGFTNLLKELIDGK